MPPRKRGRSPPPPPAATGPTDHLGRPLAPKASTSPGAKPKASPSGHAEGDALEDENAESAEVQGPLVVRMFVSIGDFFSTSFGRGICHYLLLLLLPLWWIVEAVLELLDAPPPLPAFAPPAPPPPPASPTTIAAVNDWIFGAGGFAEEYPVSFLLIAMSIFTAIGIFFLFLKDINEWIEAQQAAARQAKSRPGSPGSDGSPAYQKLDEEDPEKGRAQVLIHGELLDAKEGEGAGGDAGAYDPHGPAIVELESDQPQEVTSVAELRKELALTKDKVEELEIKTKVHKKSTTDAANTMRTELARLIVRRDELKRIVEGAAASTEESTAEEAPNEEEASSTPSKGKARPRSRKSFGGTAAHALADVLQGAYMNILTNTATGAFAIIIYFMDIWSDVQVFFLLYETGNYLWAWMSMFLIVVQFLVVYLRVLPYLRTTFGSRSSIYLTFLILGFPSGLIFLDFLMFLEPFGLLTALPFPPWMKQFIPAYKATRVIAEIVIESLPQSMLQGFIYVVVLKDIQAGTASPPELAMLGEVSLMPKSILISFIASLKTWIELVHAAREAGQKVLDKALQLWNVGAGMPLDALKKGTIVEWECPYRLDRSEVTPLLDALSKNSSLSYLNLGRSGITWDGPASEGLFLVQMMAQVPATLSALRKFVIRERGYEMPILRLRDPAQSLTAIRQAHFFSPDGPRREEVLLMGDLLRKNEQADPPSDMVVKMLGAARAGKLKRTTWEETLTRLMVEGTMPRGHLMSLISAEALRDVGFSASEMLATGHTLPIMRAGGYLASELRAIGLKAGELGASGYTPTEMRIGGYKAKDLKAAEFTAAEMKGGGYMSRELKEVGFSAAELKANGYTARELRDGTFAARDLKPLNYSAEELRIAGFEALELRDVGFTLAELKAGEYSASELKGAKYYANEMRAAGFKAKDLKARL